MKSRAIESSFVPIALMYEHRLYLPLIGPALLVSQTLFGFRPRPAPWLRERAPLAGAQLAGSLFIARPKVRY